MNFDETLDYLYDLLPMYQRVGKIAFKKNLTNTLDLCKHLDNPQFKFKSVHIAGTNGKGSSAHMIASVLQEAGFRVGLYTSPHLYRFTERIRVNGMEIDPEYIVDFVETNKEAIEKIRPSFFELTVAMSFDYFAKSSVDIAIIETGLGGRLDSTNIIIPVVSLITNISFDHTDLLGDTIAEIAGEKAGIIKEGVPVVIGEDQEEAAEVFIDKAFSQGAPVYFANETVDAKLNKLYIDSMRMDISCDTWGYLPSVLLNNSGEYQLKNIRGVIKVLELLNQKGLTIDEGAIRSGLASVKKNTGLSGRWEILSKQPLVVCDTAHNVAGVEEVAKQLKHIKYEHLHVVWGMVAEKDVVKVIELLPDDANYYFCKADVPRAMNVSALMESAAGVGRIGAVYNTVKLAINAAMNNAGVDDLILIGGSNFVVAEIDRSVYEKETTKI